MPTNTSAATATAIGGLPESVSQNVHEGGTTYTVWYRYTAVDDDVWIGAWAFGDLVTYRPTLSVWTFPSGAPVSYLGIQGENVPVQIPVTGGTTYYFKIEPNSGNPSPAVVALALERGPQDAVPIGSIAVPDDTDGFPVVFVHGTTGAILQALHPFAAGEAADILDTGVVAMANAWDVTIEVYSPTLAPLATLPFPGASESFGFIRAHRSSGTFYVGDGTTGDVRTVTAAGAFGPTTWTTGAGALIAVAPDGAATTLYYSDTSDNKVKRWNLSTNTTAGDFQPYLPGTQATDLLVLSTGTILVSYTTTSTVDVVAYNAAGTVLHTYAFTGLAAPFGTVSRLASAVDDPASFWLWTHHFAADLASHGLSKFRNIRVSDGAVLTTLDTTEFETGIHQPPAEVDPVRFGHSFSCPFWVTRTVIPPGPGWEDPDPPGPTPAPVPAHTIDERLLRRLRRAPHVNHEHKRVFFRSFELDLERGQGLVTGQGEDPLITLRLSRDGGQTWGQPIPMHAGRLGAYTQRVLARRLGVARDTVFEVTVSDPVAWSLVGAWLDLEPGTS